MTKFYEYINEDLSSKFFDLIGSPEKATFSDLFFALKNELNITLLYKEKTAQSKDLKNYFFNGAFNHKTRVLVVSIPNDIEEIFEEPLSYYPLKFLGSIIHELGHSFQTKQASKILNRYIQPHKSGGFHGFMIDTLTQKTQYIDYFLQPAERPQMVVSMIFELIDLNLSVKDFVNDIKQIKAIKGTKIKREKIDELYKKIKKKLDSKYGNGGIKAFLESLTYIYSYAAVNDLRTDPAFYSIPSQKEFTDKIDAKIKALIRSLYKHYPKIKKLYDLGK